MREEFAACAANFFYFVKYLTVNKYVWFNDHYESRLVPFEQHSFHERLINSFENERFNLVIKPRQIGFSTLVSVYALWKAMFRLDQSIMINCKTDREAIDHSCQLNHIVERMPDDLKPKFGKKNDHQWHLEETNSRLYFHTCEAACGKALNLLILEEAAFIPNIDSHWKAMYPTLSTGGSCIVGSTPNGDRNWFYETCMNSWMGGNSFKVNEVRFYEHPFYQDKGRLKEMRNNLGQKGFHQEVLCEFLPCNK